MNIDLYSSLQIAMAILLGSAVIVPLLSGKRKLAGWLNFILVTAAAVVLLNISFVSIFQGGAATQKVLGVYMLIDGFSGFFIGIISFLAIMSSFYSIQYMEHYADYKLWSYYLCFPLFILGMIGIVTVDDLSTGFTIAWQIMTVASYFLIRFEYKEKGNIRNANKYLILMELAWVLILAGTFFISGFSWGDSLHSLVEKLGATSGASLFIVYGLILIGFGFKAGMFPFGQLWLPDAHSIAPSPISALLSGVMIKTGVYGIIRTFFWMVPKEGFNGMVWGIIIASFGAVTLFVGTTQALKQHDAKRLHAYHSIGQMGYIILGIGSALVMLNSPSVFVKALSVLAIIGAMYHTLNHTVFKGLLFLSTGSVLYATGTKDLNKLGGLIKIMPVTALVAGIASLSIAGMPSFSGFASKWTIISSDILAGNQSLMLAIFGIIALFTSAVTLASYVKFFGMTFTSSGVEWTVKKEIKEVPWTMLLPKVILAMLCLAQGLLPILYFETFIGIFKNSAGSSLQAVFGDVSLDNYIVNSAMGVSVTVPGLEGAVSSVAVPLVVLIILAAAYLFAWLLKKSGGAEEKEVPTWLCGYQDLNNNNRYVAHNMYSAFKKAVKWTGGNVKK
ncbi:MAG TPA: proton-conducting transporter membrane subunit [Spirochaetota bacterium]|nr:proton-conducting transporter membrane subunit [Spirochaetota bacterium]HQF09559.1 proton-conducting transporter membrane subunit [Spirochaetota bacterium]HQH98371.1 proton-conducting transporter membrane subunit [Spirochaetota bacterium]HQJ71624.1 proton-conducting transporter membrane subunit [Spirochaetota bacterium]HRS78359.1 proton-conducting transporter membrane subunit [Spirochaetota bacterium]